MDIIKIKLKAIIARSRVNEKRLRKVLKKGRRDGNVGNYRSASDILKGGRAVAYIGGSCGALSNHARSGRAARPRDGYSKAHGS